MRGVVSECEILAMRAYAAREERVLTIQSTVNEAEAAVYYTANPGCRHGS